MRQRGARHPIAVSAHAKASQGSNRLVPRARSSRRCVELPCCAPTARLSMRARTSWSGRRQLCKFCPPLRAAAMHLTGSPKERSPEHVDAAVRRGRWFAQGYVAAPGGNAVRALVAVGQTGSGPIAIKPVIKTRDHEGDVGANGSARNPGIIARNKTTARTATARTASMSLRYGIARSRVLMHEEGGDRLLTGHPRQCHS